MYIRNNKGPNILPCGMPLNTLNHDDFSPFKTTHCFLLHRKSVIHSSKSVSMLYVFILSSNLCKRANEHTGRKDYTAYPTHWIDNEQYMDINLSYKLQRPCFPY